jgi:RNA polymerase sigma factor (sigma-70 family)
MTDAELLAEFRDRHSDAAFSTLVGRHAGWVYAVARRRVGDEHLAHDVAQAVFVLFAEQASKIRDPARLGGWLMSTTIHAANHATRGERRRRLRERAVAESRPEVHTAADPSVTLANLGDLAAVEEAVGRLNDADRSAVVLRFYRGMSLAEVGQSLGISEEAARKRLDRALIRIRHRLESRGVTAAVCAGLLAGLLSMNRQASALNIQSSASLVAGAGKRTLSIRNGVKRMRRLTRIKAAAVLTAMLLGSGGGLLLACDHWRKSAAVADVPPTTAPVAAAAQPPAPAETTRTVEASGIITVVSADHTTLTGFTKATGEYSQIHGEKFDVANLVLSDGLAVYTGTEHVYAYTPLHNSWTAIAVHTSNDQSVFKGPVVSNSVAAVSVPGTVYAYSNVTASWAPLKVTGTKPVDPVVDANTVRIESDNQLDLYAAKTGTWLSGL